MKLVFAFLTAGVFVGCGQQASLSESGLLSIDVRNRRPVSEIQNYSGVRQYAKSHVYNDNWLREGMEVMFSASYGIGGEAGQSRGVLVEKDGKLFYKQERTVTNQILQPPGLPFNSSHDTSLWEMDTYVDLINHVAFAEKNRTYAGTIEQYAQVSANLVDFTGGTARRNVDYADALEVQLEKSNRNGSTTDVVVYFAKNVGPVALEYRESGSVAGTFKLYIGRRDF